jgi:NTE family protein
MKSSLILLCLLVYLKAQTQVDSIKNLVFEGAGIRGIAYSGVIEQMEKNSFLSQIKRVGGTSSGSITALLLSIGYNANEITSIVNNTPYKKFNDGNFFFPGGINRLQKYFGWYRGQQFDRWLSKLIETKTADKDITFRQLKEKGFKDLYVTGTCLNKQSLIIFSHETYPNMKIRDAVRISISIPLYFEAVFIDSNGSIVHHPKNKTGLDIMVDGGFIANFPIRIFDSTRFTDATKPNEYSVNRQTLGFRIDREEQIEKDKTGAGLASIEIHSFGEYIGAFYNIIIENLNRQTLTKDDWLRTISISDGNVGPRVRKLSKEEVEVLVNNGAQALKDYLSR